MSEGTTAGEPAGAGTTTPAPEAPKTTGQEPAEGGDRLEFYKGLARDMETRANKDQAERAKVQQELEQLRQERMTTAEKELAKARKEAMEEGRAAALTEVGKELVAAELRAVLKGRHDDPDTVIDALDPGRFLKDGRPDRAAIQAWADKAHPERPSGVPSFGQGRRTQAPSDDMNSRIRRLAGQG